MSRVGGRILAGVAAAVVVGGGLAAWRAAPSHPPGEGGEGRAVPAVVRHVAVPVKPAPTGPLPSLIANLHSRISYSSRPGGPPAGSLAAENPFGQAQVLAVVGGPLRDGWVKVELPIRPDGSVGWIRASGVTFTETSYRVVVDVATRTLTVYDGARRVVTTAAAIGAPSTPTPPARTYLWELIRPDDPAGAYGPYIFGLALYSNAIAVFNGGDAQIGIHGQDEPWSIGHADSHGCVRLPNPVITQLAGLLPLGTPVTIS